MSLRLREHYPTSIGRSPPSLESPHARQRLLLSEPINLAYHRLQEPFFPGPREGALGEGRPDLGALSHCLHVLVRKIGIQERLKDHFRLVQRIFLLRDNRLNVAQFGYELLLHTLFGAWKNKWP